MCIALAFLPVGEVGEGFQMVRSVAHHLRPNLDAYFDTYFLVQWMQNAGIARQMWNVFLRRERTNNIAESYHSSLNGQFDANNPPFYEFLDQLMEKEDVTRKQRNKIEAGQLKRRKVAKYENCNRNIDRLETEYNARPLQQRPLFRAQYLKGIAHNLSEMTRIREPPQPGM